MLLGSPPATCWMDRSIPWCLPLHSLHSFRWQVPRVTHRATLRVSSAKPTSHPSCLCTNCQSDDPSVKPLPHPLSRSTNHHDTLPYLSSRHSNTMIRCPNCHKKCTPKVLYPTFGVHFCLLIFYWVSSALRKWAVTDSLDCATCSGVPVATTQPPPRPPSGPMSMI